MILWLAVAWSADLQLPAVLDKTDVAVVVDIEGSWTGRVPRARARCAEHRFPIVRARVTSVIAHRIGAPLMVVGREVSILPADLEAQAAIADATCRGEVPPNFENPRFRGAIEGDGRIALLHWSSRVGWTLAVEGAWLPTEDTGRIPVFELPRSWGPPVNPIPWTIDRKGPGWAPADLAQALVRGPAALCHQDDYYPESTWRREGRLGRADQERLLALLDDRCHPARGETATTTRDWCCLEELLPGIAEATLTRWEVMPTGACSASHPRSMRSPWSIEEWEELQHAMSALGVDLPRSPEEADSRGIRCYPSSVADPRSPTNGDPWCCR